MDGAATSMLAEADLHGLVDGYIAPDRRTEALRRLAVSPNDRARVEAWQGQNDLLRSAFLGIVREPVPAILDLKVKPQLHCVAANDAPVVDFPHAPAAPPRRRFGAALAALLVIGAGLGGSWVLLSQTKTDQALPGVDLRGPIDVTLASRSVDAIKQVPVAGLPRHPADSLPTTDIPDLRAAGFSFSGAETSGSAPVSIVFRYQNGNAERVAVSVAAPRMPDNVATTAPVQVGGAYSWHKGDKAYAIAGTIRPARLRALALALQRDDAQ